MQNNKLWHFDIFQQWYSNIFIFSKTGSSDTLIICKKMICDTLISLYVANEWIVIFWYREDMHKYNHIDCGDCCLIVEITVWFWRLQSDSRDCSLIVVIAVWNEWRLNGREFLSTNERPRFWALNQWEASISGPPI